jgi:AbrB family looped-hinge helix DNA binding protein
MAYMKAISLDKAGRVVLPKDLRDKLRLEAGDELLVEETGEQIILRPVRAQRTLKKERGVWVYQGARGAERSNESLPDLIDAAREKRLRELSK